MDPIHILFKFEFNQLHHLFYAYKIILNCLLYTPNLVHDQIALRGILMLLSNPLNLHLELLDLILLLELSLKHIIFDLNNLLLDITHVLQYLR